MKAFLCAVSTVALLAVSGTATAQKAPSTGAPAQWGVPVHDGKPILYGVADRLDYRAWEGVNGYLWDAQGWVGNDKHKLWLKSEGEGAFGDPLEAAELQALYGRILSPFFDAQVGVRQDLEPGPYRTYAIVGLQGLAPYLFELDTALFVSTHGELTARVEAEYDLLFTQRLVLQPRGEINLAAQDVEELQIGAGITTVEAGARLRYEITRQLAPYVGIAWERAVGGTAVQVRRAGEDPGALFVVAGIRTWF